MKHVLSLDLMFAVDLTRILYIKLLIRWQTTGNINRINCDACKYVTGWSPVTDTFDTVVEHTRDCNLYSIDYKQYYILQLLVWAGLLCNLHLQFLLTDWRKLKWKECVTYIHATSGYSKTHV